MENKIARFMRNTGPARILVPVGLILIIFGCLLLGFKTDDYVETVGKITSVTVNVNADNEEENTVNFSYTVDGKQYEGVFENLSGTYKVGDDIKVYYDPADPLKITNSKAGKFLAPIFIVVGAAAVIYGIYRTVKAFKKSKELDAATPGKGAPSVNFEAFKYADTVTEYYSRFDGNGLRPGYILEDKDRNILFEGKMLKNNLVGPRLFEFNNHKTGQVSEHEVGHVMTESFNNEFFSMKSWFKLDGKNIFDVLHDRGLRMTTDLISKLPYAVYEVSKDGKAFARIESSSKYVHEDEEQQHKVVVPFGRYYYRIWTDSDDFETIFLTIFAISESEQAVVE